MPVVLVSFRWAVLPLLLLVGSLPAAAESSVSYEQCLQAGRAFIEGTALTELCAIPTQSVPEELVRVAGAIGDTLDQCERQLTKDDIGRLFAVLEADFNKRPADLAKEGSLSRLQFCANGRDKLNHVLRSFSESQ